MTVLLVYEVYRRLYPVIHDNNNIFLGNSTGWNIQIKSGTLTYSYNSSNMLTVSNTGNTTQKGSLSLANGSYAVALQTGTLSTNSLYTLPASVGAQNQVLTVTGFVTGVNTLGWTNLSVLSGGTGLTNMSNPYGMLCAGSTTSSALQCMPTGTTGQICISGGSNALPTWSSTTIDTNGNISCSNLTSTGA